MGLHLVVGQRSCEPNKHPFLQNVQLSFVFIAMTDNQLYVANFPFSFGEKEICACVVERFPTPERIVPLHRGKAGPMRRLSCFIHWHPGNCPAPEDMSGWIPNMLAALGWTVPLMASWPFAPWLKRHHGATNRQGAGALFHTGSCKGRGLWETYHNLVRNPQPGGPPIPLRCSCCEWPPECPICLVEWENEMEAQFYGLNLLQQKMVMMSG